MGDILRFIARHVVASAVGAVGIVLAALGYADQAGAIVTNFEAWQLQASGAGLFALFVILVLVSYDNRHLPSEIAPKVGQNVSTTPVVSPPAQKNLPPPDQESRIFLSANIDPFSLMASCEGKTSFHAEQAVAPYIGKWLRHRQPIKNVTKAGDSLVIIFEAKGHCYVRASTKDFSVADVLHERDEIEVVGKITQIEKFFVSLDEAEIVAR